MPAKVKQGFSVTILTTLFTSIILAVLGWTGTGTLKAYQTEVDVGYVKGQLETMNQSLVEVIVLFHEKSVMLEKHQLRLKYCENKITECEKHYRK